MTKKIFFLLILQPTRILIHVNYKNMSSSHLGSPTIYPFYVINSDESIRTIHENIQAEYDKFPNQDELKEIVLVRCMWLKGKETNYTLCVFDENVYEQILDSNSMDIEKCRVSMYNKPSESQTRNLFVSLPRELSLSDCMKILDNLMSDLILYEVWKKRDFNIVYPGRSRSDDMHTGKAHIYFENKDESIEKIALTRMFIGGREWENTTRKIECNWKRRNIRRKDGPNIPRGRTTNIPVKNIK